MEKLRTDGKKLTKDIMASVKKNSGDKVVRPSAFRSSPLFRCLPFSSSFFFLVQMIKKLMKDFETALKKYEEVSQAIEKRLGLTVEAAEETKSGPVLLFLFASSSFLTFSVFSPSSSSFSLQITPDRRNSNARGGRNGRKRQDSDPDEPVDDRQQQQQKLLEEQDLQFLEYNVEELEARRQNSAQIERDVGEVCFGFLLAFLVCFFVPSSHPTFFFFSSLFLSLFPSPSLSSSLFFVLIRLLK
jgi:hypothetical protein